MSGLQGLGSLAMGLSRGLADGQQLAAQREELDWRRSQREREQRRQSEEDRLLSDTRAADQAMMDTMAGFRKQAESQQSGPENYLRNGGSDGSLPDQGAIDAAPAAQPWRPNEQQLLAAAQARTNRLFELGRHDLAAKQWIQDEGLRAQMRKSAVQQGVQAFKATGDVEPLLRNVYSTIDDGYDLDGVQKVNNQDPKAPVAWDVQRRNQRTGETKTSRITADQVDGLMQFAMDPVQAARYSLMEKLAGYRGDEQRRTNAEKAEQRSELEDKKIDAATKIKQMSLDGAITVAQIRASAAGQRGLASAGGKGNGVLKTITADDGSQIMIFRNGDRKLITDDDGNPVRGIDYQKLINRTADAVGKSVEGLTATPEANRKRAEAMLPGAGKPRRSLGDAAPSAPGSSSAGRPPLSSFQRN